MKSGRRAASRHNVTHQRRVQPHKAAPVRHTQRNISTKPSIKRSTPSKPLQLINTQQTFVAPQTSQKAPLMFLGKHISTKVVQRPFQPINPVRMAPSLMNSDQVLFAAQRFRQLNLSFNYSDGTKDQFLLDYEANKSKTVMEIAIANNVDLEASCGGELNCSTCHVKLDQTLQDYLANTGCKATVEEEDMLDLAIDSGPNSRLSCQIPLAKLPTDQDKFDFFVPQL